MLELSEYIYNILNVVAITNIATGGIAPLLAEQEVTNFVNYEFGSKEDLTKDGRVALTLKVNCYATSYNKALEMFDAVETELKPLGKLINFDSSYLFEQTNDCVVMAVFDIKRKIV